VAVEPDHDLGQRHTRRLGEVASRARPYDGSEVAVDRIANLDSGTIDARMKEGPRARGAVAEVDHGMHAAHPITAVWLRQMHRQAVMKRDRAARHLDVNRCDSIHLWILENLYLLIRGKDVDELSEPQGMRARHVSHASVFVS